MVLVPADQYYQQQHKTVPPPSNPATLPPDVELKLIRQHETPFSSQDQIVPVSQLFKRPPGAINAPEIGEKLDRLLQHLQRNPNRVQADKRTGELVFDGRPVPGSDVRRLFGDVVAKKARSIKPRGWDELRDVLEYTHAPEEVLGQDWSTVKARAEMEKAERDRAEFEKIRPKTRGATKQAAKQVAQQIAKKAAQRTFNPSDWQHL